MTVTSEGSAIEARIRSLKQQIRQRQREEKRVRNEKNRKRKAMLKQHEEQLKKKLEVRTGLKDCVLARLSEPSIDTNCPHKSWT